MTIALKLARSALSFIGKSKAEINVLDTQLTQGLKHIIKEKPAKIKNAIWWMFHSPEKVADEFISSGLLKETLSDGFAKFTKLSDAEIKMYQHQCDVKAMKETASCLMKEIRHGANVLAGRTLLYPVNKTFSAFISKDFKNLLKDIVKLPKHEFGFAYYQKLIRSNGLIERAPQKIVVNDKTAGMSIEEAFMPDFITKYRCQGGFNPQSNTIEFTKEFSSLPKWYQTNLITHELKHFEQADTIIRTFGIERYMSALKNNMLKTLKKSPKNAGKNDIQLQEIIDIHWAKNDIEKTMREAFKGSINAPKINPASEMGKNAEAYLKAQENYVGLGDGLFISVSKDYIKNPLEVEAYKTGNRSGLKALILQNLNFKTL